MADIVAKTQPAAMKSNLTSKEMVIDALTGLNEKTGSSYSAMMKFIKQKFQLTEQKEKMIKRIVKEGIDTGFLKNTRGKGVGGKRKLNENFLALFLHNLIFYFFLVSFHLTGSFKIVEKATRKLQEDKDKITNIKSKAGKSVDDSDSQVTPKKKKTKKDASPKVKKPARKSIKTVPATGSANKKKSAPQVKTTVTAISKKKVIVATAAKNKKTDEKENKKKAVAATKGKGKAKVTKAAADDTEIKKKTSVKSKSS